MITAGLEAVALTLTALDLADSAVPAASNAETPEYDPAATAQPLVAEERVIVIVLEVEADGLGAVQLLRRFRSRASESCSSKYCRHCP